MGEPLCIKTKKNQSTNLCLQIEVYLVCVCGFNITAAAAAAAAGPAQLLNHTHPVRGWRRGESRSHWLPLLHLKESNSFVL